MTEEDKRLSFSFSKRNDTIQMGEMREEDIDHY